MILVRGNQPCRLLLVGLLATSQPALALQFNANAGLGVEYSDNVAEVASNEQEDLILHANLAAILEESTGPLLARAEASWNHQNYRDNSFGDQDYFSLGAVADWEQLRDRLSWNIRDYYTQTSINSLGTDTPDNTENTNAFSFGPTVRFPVSARQDVFVAPFFSDYTYEESNLDNRRYGLSAGWSYQMYPTMKVGLEGDVIDVNYEDINTDYRTSSIHSVLSGTRAHSVYRMTLGYTIIDRDSFSNHEGPTGSFSWLYNLTGKSSIRAYMASSLTDASSRFLGSVIQPDHGDFTNVQTSSDIFRDNIVRLEYSRRESTLNTRVWSEFRDLDYKEEPNDRKVQDYGAEITYDMSALITAGLTGSYVRTKQTDTGHINKEYLVGGNLRYNLSRKLSCLFNVTYEEEDSTLATTEYDELSVFAGLTYAFGR